MSFQKSVPGTLDNSQTLLKAVVIGTTFSQINSPYVPVQHG